MKKLTVLIATFLLTTLSAQALQYGVTANFHKGSIAGVHDYSKGVFGGSLGVFVDFPLAEADIDGETWLILTPQVEYHMGGEIAKAEENKFGVQKYHYDYLGMQVYLKYFFHKGGMKQNTFLFAGPRIEFMVREDVNVDPAYDAAYYKYNLDKTVNKFGYGASVGAGMKVSEKVEAFLRYDHGFSKVYPDNTIKNTYNRMLGIGVNYYLTNDRW